jgi:hypothetical protein
LGDCFTSFAKTTITKSDPFKGADTKVNNFFLALPSSKVKLFLFIPIFAIAIAKIGIKITALPERPIKEEGAVLS